MTVATSPYSTCILHGCLKVLCAWLVLLLISYLQYLPPKVLNVLFQKGAVVKNFWSLPASLIAEIISYIVC